LKPGTRGFIGERLKEGREGRGLTQTALASVLGVSRSAVSQYEKGVQTPRPEVMDSACQCLRLPLEYFRRERVEHSGAIFWRSQASATEIARNAAKRKLAWLQDLTGYLREYIDFPETNFPDFNLSQDPLRISMEEVERIALALRKYWGLGDGPLPGVMALLENNGVFISRDDLFLASLDGLSRWSRSDKTPFCLVASGKNSAARTTMDLLHELGHLILHRDLDQRYVSVPLIHKLIETQAFAFAGAFALPEESFAGDLYSLSLDSFVNLKKRWGVSIGAMIKRCETLNLTNESQAEKLWRTLSARGWRTEEPLDNEIPVDRPRLLARAIEIVLADGIQTKESIVSALALPDTDIEDMAVLSRGVLSTPDENLKVMPSISKAAESRDSTKTASILNFRKRI
jgi:Zn-dependent peptidase ImmA (M78 family)/transcriptional regulator with XRE-family HTH domain